MLSKLLKTLTVLGFIERNLKLALSCVKLMAYTSLVHLEIKCDSVWDPYHANLTSIPEAVQNRAARFVLKDYSYSSSATFLKSSLGVTQLNVHHKFNWPCLFHKFVLNFAMCMSYISNAHHIAACLDHSHKVHSPMCHNKYLSESFIRTARDCNNLPPTPCDHWQSPAFPSSMTWPFVFKLIEDTSCCILFLFTH